MKIEFAKSPDETVFGAYERKQSASPQFFRFVGRTDGSGDIVELEEFFGCRASARIVLARECTVEQERWSGHRFHLDGTTERIFVTRQQPESLDLRDEEDMEIQREHPLAVSTFAGFPGRWFPVLSTDTGFTSQVVYQDAEFPKDWIAERQGKGFRITSVSGDSAGWMIVMSKGSSLGDQEIIGPGPIDRTRFDELQLDGYRITSLGGFIDQWVLVMSKNSGLGEQAFSDPGKFDEVWVEKKKDEGFRITGVAGDSSNQGPSWVVVVSKDSGYSEQVISEGTAFPAVWIRDQAKSGYRIASATGYHGWRVVMSKGTSIKAQLSRQPALHFPIEFLRENMRERLEER